MPYIGRPQSSGAFAKLDDISSQFNNVKTTFDLTRDYVSSSLLVTTDEICAGIKDLYDETRTIAEPAGALSISGIKKFIKIQKI